MAIPPGFTPYPRPQGLPSGVRPLPPGVHIEAIGEAWGLFSREWSTWVATTLTGGVLYLVLYAPFFFLTFFLEFGTFSFMSVAGRHPSQVGQVGAFFANLIPALINAAFEGGICAMALKQLRGQPFGVGDLFGYIRFAPRIMAVRVLCSLPLTLASILFGATGQLVILLPVLCLYVAFAFSAFIIVDQEVGVWDAMRLSASALRGFGTFMGMLGFLILLGLVYMVGGCACGVGILASFPVALLGLAIHYFYFFPERFQTLAEPPVG